VRLSGLIQMNSLPNMRLSSASIISAQPPDTALARIVTSNTFDAVFASVLLANGMFIAAQVEYSFQPEIPLAIHIIDYVFLSAFLIELVLRIAGLGCQCFFCNPEGRAWNILDFIVVLLSVADRIVTDADDGSTGLANVSYLRVVRVLRLVRILRAIRTMRVFQDLRILLAAIVSTIKTATFALILMGFIMYIFAVALAQSAAEHMKTTELDASHPLVKYLGGVFKAMFSLFMTITGGVDWEEVAFPLMDIGWFPCLLFMLYVAIMTLCVMNVLLGIFCQSALDTAACDIDNVIQLQLLEKERFVDRLKNLFGQWDTTDSCECTLVEFQKHLMDEETQALLRSLEIESRDAVALFELLDDDKSGAVNLNEFITGCITMRGGAKAVHMEKISHMEKLLKANMDALNDKVDILLKRLALEPS